jgi:hypothetical protein
MEGLQSGMVIQELSHRSSELAGVFFWEPCPPRSSLLAAIII